MEHGILNLYLNSVAVEIDQAGKVEPTDETDETTDEIDEALDDVKPFNEARIAAYEAHGWWCLVAWFPIGFMLLATQRYYKTNWLLMHHLHNILGVAVSVITIMTCLQVYAHVGWKQAANAHSILGLIALLITIFVFITGLITSCMMHFYKGDKPWAERDKVYNVARVHRYSSYFMLILGNGVCSGGIATYFSKIGYGIWGTFGICSSIFFVLMFVIHECLLRKFNRKNFKLIEGEELKMLFEEKNMKMWTPTQIEHAVAAGDTLVVCDNLVLRTSGYEKFHPGGKFVI